MKKKGFFVEKSVFLLKTLLQTVVIIEFFDKQLFFIDRK